MNTEQFNAKEVLIKSQFYLNKIDAFSTAELNELVELLQYNEWRYYVKDDPIITDFDYDQLFKILEAAEKEQPENIRHDSPTQRVSSDLSSNFETVPHMEPMLSLANSYNAEDLKDFDKQIKKFCLIPEEDDIAYIVEPKFDGGTVVLVYENDRFKRGATRGNGQAGDEISNNIRTIKSIPLQAKLSEKGIQIAELRGEALIKKSDFESINEQRQIEGESLYANPRNTATGGLRTKDPKDTADRKLAVFIYQLGYALNKDGNKTRAGFSNHSESIAWLNDLGFKVPIKESKVCKNIEEAAAFCAEWENKRADYDYEVDGMVVKVDSYDIQDRTGNTAHHPRWAIAYKFQAKQANTILENVEFQVGKIGTITPVAKVKPVSLAGVTISSISLHNADFIESKDLHYGDTVLIERAGDVIPYIVKAFPELRNGTETVISFPSHCPIAIDHNTEAPALERDVDEAAWRCPYSACTCGMQDVQRMIFFVSKDAMDIDGMGASIIERFHQEGWLNDLSDVFSLDFEKISGLENFGAKSAINLNQAISNSKSNSISRLLYALSIHHLGKKAAKLLAAEIDHVLDLKDWSEAQFLELNGIGPVLAANVSEFFSVEKNIDLLKKLEALGVNLKQTEADKPIVVDEDAPLAGKTILFTGKLHKIGRKEAQHKATLAGAKNISAVSSNLNILVVGEKAGSKLKKALALGTVEVWTEDEFIERIS